jgi:hypothetical protein
MKKPHAPVRRLAMALSVLAWTAGTFAQPQTSPARGGCEGLRGAPGLTSLEVCDAHRGCNLVLRSKPDCEAAKRFLGNLHVSLEGRTRITNNDVFEANSPELMPHAMLKDTVALVRDTARLALSLPTNGRLEYTTALDQQAYYEGGLKDGRRDGIGVTVLANGNMERGRLVEGRANGWYEVVFSNGQVIAGTYHDGSPTMGSFQLSNRTVGVGQWEMQKPAGTWEYTYPNGNTQSVLYGADGKQLEAGPQVPPRRPPASGADDPKVVGGVFRP